MRPTPRTRLATHADKDVWVNTMISGYEVDPQYQWRNPRRKEYPEDTKRATAELFDKIIANTNATCFVAELPRIGEEEELENAEWVVVALANWEWVDLDDLESQPGNEMPLLQPFPLKLVASYLFNRSFDTITTHHE
jgi:hypothetical protein